MAGRSRIHPFVRRLRRQRYVAGALLVILCFTSVCSHRVHGPSALQVDGRKAHVTHIDDGDTIDVTLGNGQNERVRLKGIDAPEIAHKSGDADAYWGRESAKYLSARVMGKDVLLKLDGNDYRDPYGRLLAFVYVGDECINLSMVRDGQAYMHRKYQDHYLRTQMQQAENDARKKSRGLWKDLRPDQMPAWRQDWLAKAGAPSAR